MYNEIQSVVNFLASFLYNRIPRRKIALFSDQLGNYLMLKFQNHWYLDDPQKGSAYRCIRINQNGLTDALIGTAAQSVGLNPEEILKNLPADLHIWVDPNEVSFRVGEYSKQQPLYSAAAVEEAIPVAPAVPDWSPMQETITPTPMMQPVLFDSASAHLNDQKFTVGTFAMTRFGTTKVKSATKPQRRPSPPNHWPQALEPQQDMFTSFNPMGSGQVSPFGNGAGNGVYHAQFSPPMSQLPSPMPSPEPSLYAPPMMQAYAAAQLGY